jgi:hypothetical protein
MTEFLSKENGSYMSSWIKFPEKLINLYSAFNTMQMAKYSKYLPLIGITDDSSHEEESASRHLYDFKEFLKYWGLKSSERGYIASRNDHVMTDAFNRAFPVFVEYRNSFVLFLEKIEEYLTVCHKQNELLITIWEETSEKLADNISDYINEFVKFAGSVINEFDPDTGETEEKHNFMDVSSTASTIMNVWMDKFNELLATTPLYGNRDDIIKIKSDVAKLREKMDSINNDATKAEILSLLKKDIKMMRANHNSDVQNILNAIAALRVDIIDNKKTHLKAGIKAA